jgi:hypothetical protein
MRWIAFCFLLQIKPLLAHSLPKFRKLLSPTTHRAPDQTVDPFESKEDWVCENFASRNITGRGCLKAASMARLRLGKPLERITPSPTKSGFGIIYTLPMGYARLIMVMSAIMYQMERWGLLDGVEIHSEHPSMIDLCNEARPDDPTITCVLIEPKFTSRLKGFPLKILALLNSKFRHILFLDCDSIPLMDPAEIFHSEEYTRSKAIFWPDVFGLACKGKQGDMQECGQTGWPNHILYPTLNLTWDATRSYAQEMETGQFFVRLYFIVPAVHSYPNMVLLL